MTKYKRWILILSALTVLVVHVQSLKATSLIHSGKYSRHQNATSTSTTSTTEEAPNNKSQTIADDVPAAPEEQYAIDANGTKVLLTGIPQIDYVWDPNLPRELNGFNLSTYPFLDSMPSDEDIAFDCEDKINGFYASVKYGCQLYHHCLYGVRSDFICANFTAFDQKTFICHFASEVDCKNSKKYWSRNDDLYKATTVRADLTSSTVLPLIDRNIYKRPAGGGGSYFNGNSQAAPQNTGGHVKDQPQNSAPINVNLNNNGAMANNEAPAVAGGLRPTRPLRRPYRRRRPQYDYYYYDDEYEEEAYDDRGRRRQRPRNRRPVYDDYDNRRPFDDRERRPANDDFDDYEYDRRPYRNRNRSESRRNGDDRRRQEDRRFDDRRRPYNNDDRRPSDDRRKPDERRPIDDRRESDDRRSIDDRKFKDDRKENRNRNNNDHADDKSKDSRRSPTEYTDKKQVPDETATNEKLTKPSASVFDRPRAPPRIPRPVPINEKNKFSYKSTEKPKSDPEYYEDYEENPASSSTPSTTTIKAQTAKGYYQKFKVSSSLSTTIKPSTTTAAEVEYYDDEYYDNVTPSSKAPIIETTSVSSKTIDERSTLFSNRNRNFNDNLPIQVSSSTPSTTTERFNRFKNDKTPTHFQPRENQQSFLDQNSPSTLFPSRNHQPTAFVKDNKKFASKQTVFETPTTETPKPVDEKKRNRDIIDKFYSKTVDTKQDLADLADEKDLKPLVRIVKRPFLPSRGGNPYKARDLQPVGVMADILQQDQPVESQYSAPNSEQLPLRDPDYAKNKNYNDDANAPLKLSTNIQHTPETHKSSLDDLYIEEYDADLNDALNPMLKPLTSSRGNSGFSFSSLPANEKDRFKAQSQVYRSVQKPDVSSTTTSSEPLQYDYEDVEYDY